MAIRTTTTQFFFTLFVPPAGRFDLTRKQFG
jgi:hypothetical protein